jgi:hypothetical protein
MHVCAFFLAALASQPISAQTGGTAQIQDLKKIGADVTQAVLSKDPQQLLRFDRTDLRSEDTKLLADKQSHLYCYIFDTSCNVPHYKRSIYDILSSAHQLEIGVRDLGRDQNGNRYMVLLFYDKAILSRGNAQSLRYLCKQVGQTAATWTFKWEKRGWESAHPPFDAETESLCASH